MIDSIQKWLSIMGEGACYYLTLLKILENRFKISLDVVKCFDLDRKMLYVGDDAYVERPNLILQSRLGGTVTVLKAGPGHELPMDYELAVDEVEVLRFDLNGKAHFVLGSGRGPMDKTRVAWDPWGDSKTVREGTLVSRRIVRFK